MAPVAWARLAMAEALVSEARIMHGARRKRPPLTHRLPDSRRACFITRWFAGQRLPNKPSTANFVSLS